MNPVPCSGFAHLQQVDGGEVAAEAVDAPVGERQLHQPKQAVDRIVDGHHAPKVGEPKQRAEDRIVRRVQEEAARAPHHQRDNLQQRSKAISHGVRVAACAAFFATMLLSGTATSQTSGGSEAPNRT